MIVLDIGLVEVVRGARGIHVSDRLLSKDVLDDMYKRGEFYMLLPSIRVRTDLLAYSEYPKKELLIFPSIEIVKRASMLDVSDDTILCVLEYRIQ